VLTVSIDSDTLYPPYQQELIHQTLSSLGGDATHVQISSPDGHDAFLLETDAVGHALLPFLSQIEKGDR
jgi:homoserine O-acetyltransferase